MMKFEFGWKDKYVLDVPPQYYYDYDVSYVNPIFSTEFGQMKYGKIEFKCSSATRTTKVVKSVGYSFRRMRKLVRIRVRGKFPIRVAWFK